MLRGDGVFISYTSTQWLLPAHLLSLVSLGKGGRGGGNDASLSPPPPLPPPTPPPPLPPSPCCATACTVGQVATRRTHLTTTGPPASWRVDLMGCCTLSSLRGGGARVSSALADFVSPALVALLQPTRLGRRESGCIRSRANGSSCCEMRPARQLRRVSSARCAAPPPPLRESPAGRRRPAVLVRPRAVRQRRGVLAFPGVDHQHRGVWVPSEAGRRLREASPRRRPSPGWRCSCFGGPHAFW